MERVASHCVGEHVVLYRRLRVTARGSPPTRLRSNSKVYMADGPDQVPGRPEPPQRRRQALFPSLKSYRVGEFLARDAKGQPSEGDKKGGRK